MKSLKGHLLIAGQDLLDPNFVQSVVLIVHHDDNGAMGVILNRPLEVTLRQACESLGELECKVEGVLHQGGPCQGPLVAVHGEADLSDIEVADAVHFSSERQHVEWLLNHPDSPAIFLVGYSGWSKGQLEDELESGAWLIVPASPGELFGSQGNLWRRLITRAALSRWVDPSRIPPDPRTN